MHRILALLLSVCLFGAAFQAGPVKVRVHAVLVDRDLNQKPVPFLEVAIERTDAASAPVQIKTALDGTAETSLPPGTYTLRSVEPLEFHVRHIDGGVVSRYVIEELKVGDVVQAEGPFGVSHLRNQHRGPIIVIAGSTGLAPAISIIESAIDYEMTQPIRLYYGARSEDDFYDIARLEDLARDHENVTVDLVLSSPNANGTPVDGRRFGMVTDAVAEDYAGPQALDGAKAWIAAQVLV